MFKNELKVVSKNVSGGSAKEMIINKLLKSDETDLGSATEDAIAKIKEAEIKGIQNINSSVSSAIGDITEAADLKIQEIKSTNVLVKDQNGGTELRVWTGTQTEFDALVNPDTSIIYLIKGI